MMREESRFRRGLDRSWEAVQALAWHYRRLGYRVDIPDPRVRPSRDERVGYGDDYDMVVARRWCFEVKWRGIDFTCAADFPYPTVMVDRAEKVARRIVQLSGYLMVSQKLTHGVLIRTDTQPRWIERETFDRTKGYGLRVLECPVALGIWKPII